MGHQHREVVLTIRVDRCLAEMLKRIPNRSAFIRDAIRDALAHQCPACCGAGVIASTDHPGPGVASATETGQHAAAEA